MEQCDLPAPGLRGARWERQGAHRRCRRRRHHRYRLRHAGADLSQSKKLIVHVAVNQFTDEYGTRKAGKYRAKAEGPSSGLPRSGAVGRASGFFSLLIAGVVPFLPPPFTVC